MVLILAVGWHKWLLKRFWIITFPIDTTFTHLQYTDIIALECCIGDVLVYTEVFLKSNGLHVGTYMMY